LDEVKQLRAGKKPEDDDCARDLVRAACLMKLGRDRDARAVYQEAVKWLLPGPAQKIPQSSRSDGVPFTMAGNLYDEFKKSFGP
jgi:hypothetical protein